MAGQPYIRNSRAFPVSQAASSLGIVSGFAPIQPSGYGGLSTLSSLGHTAQNVYRSPYGYTIGGGVPNRFLSLRTPTVPFLNAGDYRADAIANVGRRGEVYKPRGTVVGVKVLHSESHDEGGEGKGVQVKEKKKYQQHEREKSAVYEKGYDSKKYKTENQGYDFDRGFRYAYQYGHLFFNPVPAKLKGQDYNFGHPFGTGGATYGGSGYAFNEGKGKRRLSEYDQDSHVDVGAGVERSSYASPSLPVISHSAQ